MPRQKISETPDEKNTTPRKNMSKRAIKGNISVELGDICRFCFNNKWIINRSEESSGFGMKKCSRCKRFQ